MGYLHDCLLRICEVQKDIMSPIRVDAVPYFPYSQEVFPYFYNQLGNGNYEQVSMDYPVQTRVINMYLVLAHLTEGYRGDVQTKLDDYVLKVVEGFMSPKHCMLQSQAYPTPSPHLLDAVQVVSDTGVRAFTNGGLNEQLQIGVQFELRLTLVNMRSI